MVSSGLYCVRHNQRYQLPLHHARIDASIYDLCAEVKVEQTFVNDAADCSADALECFYTFPLDEESAVFSFVCDLDGVISRGRIKEKVEARAEYESAVRQNRSAMLLEQSADNVFQCRIGLLRPGSVCTITITYLTLLDQEGRSNRFTLPMIVAPKYTPGLQGPTPPFQGAAVRGGESITINNKVHSGFQCDHCLCTPIIGTRHHCTVCSDYDLCDGCRRQPGVHDTNHLMFPVTNPATRNNDQQFYEYPRIQRDGQPTAIEGMLRDLTIDSRSGCNKIHTGFQCDQCFCTPIIGTRHRCAVCRDFDLCDGCRRQPGVHDTNHPMFMFSTDPVTRNSVDEQLDEHRRIQREGYNHQTTIQSNLRDLTINMSVRMPSRIISIRCPSHADETRIQQEHYAATVCFHSTSTSSLSCDFTLLIEQQCCFDPRVLCELDFAKRTAAISLAFVPPALDMLSASQLRCELIFLLDCSGSMRGPSISCVCECMHILLHSLPVNSRFNVIVFGSTWSSLFSSSQVYDDESLSAATEYVAHLRADLGGTEIYPPLHHALTTALLPSHPRQIFLLTDGRVSNVQQLAQLASQHVSNTRLFTFGIGTSVDRTLCKKLAQAGCGKCEFVTPTDAQGGDMREKVVRQITRAMQPVLTDVKVNWQQLSVWSSSSTSPFQGYVTPLCSTSFLQCPSVAPAIFMNSRYVLHALNAFLPDTVWQQVQAGQQPTLQLEIEITARSNHPHEAGSMRKSVVLTGEQITQASVIHTLAARARIRELQHAISRSNTETQKEVENEILQLALQYTLTSSNTSFVVVCQAGNEEEVLCQSRPEAEKSVFTYSNLASRCLRGGELRFGSSRPFEHFLAAAPSSSPQSLSHSPSYFGSSSAAPIYKGVFPQSLSNSTTIRDSYIKPSCASISLCSFKEVQSPRSEGLPDFPLFSTAQMDYTSHKRSLKRKGSLEVSEQEAPKDEASAFQALINLQSASGIWNLTPMLINIVYAIQPSSTITIQSLQVIANNYGVDQQVVGVLFVLVLLETQYKQRQPEWEMLATKAQYFVTQQAHIHEKLQEEIKAHIRNQLSQTR